MITIEKDAQTVYNQLRDKYTKEQINEFALSYCKRQNIKTLEDASKHCTFLRNHHEAVTSIYYQGWNKANARIDGKRMAKELIYTSLFIQHLKSLNK